jgi:site-specific DNA-methyltransferase (adenine-specific)
MSVLDGARWEVREGDCLELLRGLPDECVDLAVMDPPYNQGLRYGDFRDSLSAGDYRQQQWNVLTETSRVLRDGGTCFYLNWPEFAAQIWCMASEAGDLRPVDWVTWVSRVNPGGAPFRTASRAWIVMAKGTAALDFRGEYVNRTDPRIERRMAQGDTPREVDWWYFDLCKNVSRDKTDHPCQLPVEMVEKIVAGASRSDNLVLDPFCGSGTTGVAAVQLGRRFLGMELSGEYCAMARQRIGQAQPPLLVEATL